MFIFVLFKLYKNMSEVLYQLESATNFSEKVAQIFHKSTRSIIAW